MSVRVRLADNLVALAAVLCVAGAAYGLVQALAAEPWVRIAFRLEAAPASLDMSEQARRQLGASLVAQVADTCAWDVPRSHLTVSLDLVRRTAGASAAPAERDEAAAVARNVVRHAISCNAADANLWFLLALLDQRSSSDWSTVQASLVASNALAPHEGDLVVKRARVAARARWIGDPPLDARLERDIRDTIASSRLASATLLLSELRQAGQGTFVDRLLANLPEDRRTNLAEGTEVRRSTFGRTERYRHFEYRHHGADGP